MKVSKTIETEMPGLGRMIRKAREADRRPLTQICADAGMTPANWYRIESEETKVLPIQTLHSIEQVLGVSFGITFDEEQNNTKEVQS
ncbi:MAG: helix-turn-helix transcriptional regulator [Symploca sp. SIO2E6]|nr:helix-turn-helix transcriptional regulator [Symploca sp. SIO2E6]